MVEGRLSKRKPSDLPVDHRCKTYKSDMTESSSRNPKDFLKFAHVREFGRTTARISEVWRASCFTKCVVSGEINGL